MISDSGIDVRTAAERVFTWPKRTDPWWAWLLVVSLPFELGALAAHYYSHRFNPGRRVRRFYVGGALPTVMLYVPLLLLGLFVRSIDQTAPTPPSSANAQSDSSCATGTNCTQVGVTNPDSGFPTVAGLTPGYQARLAANCPPGEGSIGDSPVKILEQSYGFYDQAYLEMDPKLLDCFYGRQDSAYFDDWAEVEGATVPDTTVSSFGAVTVLEESANGATKTIQFDRFQDGVWVSAVEMTYQFVGEGYWLSVNKKVLTG